MGFVRKISNTDKIHIVDLYNYGLTLSEIKDLYNVSRECIAKNLRKLGVIIENGNSRLAVRGVNEKYFEEDSEGAAYFYGLLLADGCLSDNGKISIALESKDSHILETLKIELNISSKIGHCTREATGFNYSQTSFTVPSFVRSFMSLGLTSRKSTKEFAPERFKYNKHFWRGMIDGDGSIGKKSSRIYLCGSEVICNQFLEFCQEINPSIDTKTVLMKGSLYRVTISGVKAAMVLHELYSNSKFRLDRKFLLAENTLTKYPEVRHVF